MGKVDRLKIWYRDEGVVGIGKAMWVTAVYLTPLYHVLESVVGKELHEKMIRGPRLGYWPNIQNPRTFNEKVLHQKLHSDRELYTTVADKWAVREYVADKVGDEILNEVYHVTDDPATIPFEELPNEFVIKANHGCGWMTFVEDKANADYDEIRSECEAWLENSYGIQKREYWYRRIEPKVVVENFIRNDENEVPRDYKMYVFNGEVKYTHIDFDRFGSPSRRFFDRDWTPMEFRKGGIPLGPEAEKPERYKEMVEIAEALGEDFDFVRVDLYNPDSDQIIFGEMTMAPGSGISPFEPREHDFEFGSYW